MDLPQLLIERGLDAREVDAVVRRSIDEGAAFVHAVVRSGLVSEDLVAEIAATALGTILVAVDDGELDPDAVRLVPRRLALQHVAVPMGRGAGDALRVAFADPFDIEAVEAITRVTGLEIEPHVATLSGVLGAIERAYTGETTVVYRTTPGERELPAETTQRVDRQHVPSVGTAPIHRLEDEAALDQRLEALLLTLIESGIVTRADYLQTLRRLMGRER